jgi:hypothetical protein
VLGPHRIGNLRIRAGTGGHDRYEGIPRSRHLLAHDLGCWSNMEAGSNPTSSAAFALVMAQLPPAGYSWMLADAHTMVQPE